MDETLSGDVVQSVLKVTVHKPALYTCLASNRHSAGANTVKASARVTVAGRFLPARHAGGSGPGCGWRRGHVSAVSFGGFSCWWVCTSTPNDQ